MDLSWEAMWQNHRRQLEESHDWLREAAVRHHSPTMRAKAEGLRIALDLMDEAERHRGPNA